MLEQFLGPKVVDALFGEGGLLKVRALIVEGLTGGAIKAFIFDYQIPHEAYLLTWGIAIAWYFRERVSKVLIS